MGESTFLIKAKSSFFKRINLRESFSIGFRKEDEKNFLRRFFSFLKKVSYAPISHSSFIVGLQQVRIDNSSDYYK